MGRSVQKAATFDYGRVSAEVGREMQAVASRVRERHQKQIAAIIETGRDLLSVKARLEHGQFVAWIEAEFDWDKRTAQRYMSAAETFGEKNDTVSLLPPSTIYALAAKTTPEPVREAVIKRAEAGEKIDTVQVRREIREAKETEREERRVSRMSKSQRRYHERKERERGTEDRERRERAETRLRAAVAAMELIVSRLSGDDMARLRELLAQTTAIDFVDVLLGRQEAA